MDTEIVLVNIPCPTKKEAVKLCAQMIDKDLCGTAKITAMHLMYKDEKVEENEAFLMSLKTTKQKLMDIHEFILKNHSWGTPCIEVMPIVNDMC